jgi:hypothetical protein
MPHPDVSGEWSIYQTGGHKIIVNISDDGGALSGSAHYEAEGESTIIDDVIGAVAPFVVIHSMEAHGTVNEAHFEFVISWNNGARGRYTGAFQADGTLAGVAVDLEHPGSGGLWTTAQKFAIPPSPEPLIPILLPLDIDDGIDEAPRGDLTLAPDDGIDEAPRGDLMLGH